MQLVKKTKLREDVDSKTFKLIKDLKLVSSNATDPFYIRRLENLCKHLQEHPDSKGFAIKHEAIGQIFAIRRALKENQSTQLVVNEALANLGYHGCLKSKGIRVLSIDGGGMRGIIGLQMLHNIEKETGRQIHELFDLIVGVSTGAIIASFLGFHKKTIAEVKETYREIGSRIFTQTQLEGVKGWVVSHSYYNTKSYEDILKSFVGEFPMNGLNRNMENSPKVALVSSLVTEKRISPYVFRSYSLPNRIHSSFLGSSCYPVWAAVRASSAAPGYFDEFSLDGNIHHDGGILANNATHIAIHEAKRLWPSEKLHCVVSLGLGRHELPLENTKESVYKPLSLSQKFSRIVDSATDTEMVHETLNDCLEGYYRFNPYLPEYLPLDEKRPEKLAFMAEAADMYLRRNRDKLLEACKRLTASRPLESIAGDYLHTQHEIFKSKMMPNKTEL
mgnify:FL=1